MKIPKAKCKECKHLKMIKWDDSICCYYANAKGTFYKPKKGAILNAKGYDSKVWSIEVYKLENALDLINRLQAENERLKESNRLLINNPVLTWQDDLNNEIKAEAYKEFADKLKEIATQEFWETDAYVGAKQIDNLLKEIIGE